MCEIIDIETLTLVTQGKGKQSKLEKANHESKRRAAVGPSSGLIMDLIIQ